MDSPTLLAYRAAEARLLQGRALGTMSDAVEDALLDAMDGLWDALSEAEREAEGDAAGQHPVDPKALPP